MTGTVLASIIPALIQPLLTRIYTPSDFGLYGLYFALVGIFTAVAALRYELAVPLPKSDKDADQLAMLTCLVSCMVACILFIFSFIFTDSIVKILNNERIAFWILLVPPVVLFGGIYQAFNYWLIRQKAFKASAANRVVQKLIEAPSMLLFGFSKIGSGLLIGDFLGRFILGFVAYYQALRAGFTLKHYDPKNMLRLAVQYRDFPLFSALPTLADAIGMYIPVLLISSLYTDVEAGLYTNTRNMLSIPLIFVSRNLSQVLLERFVSKRNQNLPILPEVKKIFSYLSLFCIPFILLLLLFAPQLFAFIFGETWRESGVYTQILVLAYALRFVAGSIAVIFSALEKIKSASYWQVFFFISIISLLLLRPLQLSIFQFLSLLMLVESVSYVIYLFLIFRVAYQYDNSLIK